MQRWVAWSTVILILFACDERVATSGGGDDNIAAGQTGIPPSDSGDDGDGDGDGDSDSDGDGDGDGVEPDPALCEAYCAMEGECIDECLCHAPGGLCDCASPTVAQECAEECPKWMGRHLSSNGACATAFTAWSECITTVSCGDVESFFHAHPDDVGDDTPCSAEYHALTSPCLDFEPRTEYGFD